jgi:uncharacterized phage protein (TIGR01671 family)
MKSRDIYFRIWNGKKFLTGRDLDNICISVTGEVLILEDRELNLAGDEYILQQFSGLKDDNGNKIYEGDIVHYNETEIGGFAGLAEIFFNIDMTLQGPGFCMWSISVDKGLKEGQSGTGVGPFPFSCKVIGNIFENPELLN